MMGLLRSVALNILLALVAQTQTNIGHVQDQAHDFMDKLVRKIIDSLVGDLRVLQ